jgi:hypothetical protein
LCGVEHERDRAASLLAEAIPDPAVLVSLYVVRRMERVRGEWRRNGSWIAYYLAPGDEAVTSEHGDTAAEAATRLAATWRAAHAAKRLTTLPQPLAGAPR